MEGDKFVGSAGVCLFGFGGKGKNKGCGLTLLFDPARLILNQG